LGGGQQLLPTRGQAERSGLGGVKSPGSPTRQALESMHGSSARL
jgi:hypothetical protein